MLHRKSHPNNVDVTGSFETCSRAVKLYTTRIDGNKADIDVIYTPSAHVKLPESRPCYFYLALTFIMHIDTTGRYTRMANTISVSIMMSHRL